MKMKARYVVVGWIVVALVCLSGCGGSSIEWGTSSYPVQLPPSISIQNPTSVPTYSTTWSGVRLGGTISNASFVHVRNGLTGSTSEGYVNYYEGHGSWFADIDVGPGDNPITATADANGSGVITATAHITVSRTLNPAGLIINGPAQTSASTYWTMGSSLYKIALFADGTGRSTTGSTLSGNAGAVDNFTWSQLNPDSIIINNCPNCSFQQISSIQGSFSEGKFIGRVVTVGNVAETSSEAFILTSGNL